MPEYHIHLTNALISDEAVGLVAGDPAGYAEGDIPTAISTIVASTMASLIASDMLIATATQTAVPGVDAPIEAIPNPPLTNYILGFLLIGIAWGFTTPFIRSAAKNHKPPAHPILETRKVKDNWLKSKVYNAFFGVTDLLRNWRYALPLIINLTGSVWFFLLIGQAELSLTVPITNSLAFLFTVLGDWYVEGKVISRDTWIGMALCLGGIALCVQSKL